MPLRRIILIANPRAGKRARGRFEEATAVLSRAIETQVIHTEGPGHATWLAWKHGADPDSLIAICGGDGTLNEALNGLPTTGTLGLLPAGTANVVARELGIPLDLREAAKTLLSGAVRLLDTGRVRALEGQAELRPLAPAPVWVQRPADHRLPEGGRRFLMVAGFSYDAHVAARVPGAIKKALGKYAYHLQAICCYPFYRRPKLTLTTAEGGRFSGVFALIANLRRYGGDLFFAHQARFDDGLLDLVLFRGFSPREVLAGVGGAWLRRGVPESVADRVRSSWFELEADYAVPFQVDGEVFPEIRRVRIEAEPGALRMVVP